MPGGLVGGRQGSALLPAHYEQNMTCDDWENLLFHLPTCLALSLFRTGGQVVGLCGVGRRDVGGGDCTVEMSRLLGGEVRQEDRVVGTKF